MGLFSKKKKEELPTVDVPPVNVDSVNQEVPLVEDLPLPPKSEGVPASQAVQVQDSKPEEIVSVPEPSELAKEPPKIDEQMPEIPAVEEVETSAPESTDSEIKPEQTQEKAPIADDQDFSLPDFSEEDLKLVSEQPTTIETKESTEEITPIKTPEFSSTVTDQPIIKRDEAIVKEGNSQYIDTQNCIFLFEKIETNQGLIEKTQTSITGQETKNRGLQQTYKVVHDSLDAAQEQLMKIDRILFER